MAGSELAYPAPESGHGVKLLQRLPSVTLLSGLDPGELFARGMQMVDFTNQGDAWEPPSLEELRVALPDFEIKELIGCGGMGAVYWAVQRALDREVAIKILRPEMMEHDFARDRFMNEARITAQLDHPNIPAVYVLESNRARFLSAFAMKLLRGQTLEDMLEESERDNRDVLSAAVEVLLRICDALAFAHSKGVLHLDLKPSNVIVGSFRQIYLVDWGIAQRKDNISREPGRTYALEGTPTYMSPEQASSERWKIDERADIYALGGILYRILCGRAPHAAPTADESIAMATNGEFTSPDVVAAETGRILPRRLVSICLKALAPERDQRYPRVEDFQKDLERYARGISQLPQRTFAAGEAIINEGAPGDAAYVIMSGECVVTRHGQVHEFRRLKSGEMFGEAAVFTGQPRAATVSAITETVVGVIDQAMLREEMERASFMALSVRTAVSTFLDLNQQLERHRRQSHVVELALRHIAIHGQDGRVPWIPLRASLAESTGASEDDVESVILGAKGLEFEGETLVLRA